MIDTDENNDATDEEEPEQLDISHVTEPLTTKGNSTVPLTTDFMDKLSQLLESNPSMEKEIFKLFDGTSRPVNVPPVGATPEEPSLEEINTSNAVYVDISEAEVKALHELSLEMQINPYVSGKIAREENETGRKEERTRKTMTRRGKEETSGRLAEEGCSRK